MERELRMRMARGFRRMLIAVVLLGLLSQVLAGRLPPVPAGARRVPVPEARKERIARGLAAGYGLGPFQASLEMKENADFLLTPALLVQESIREDIVITYPAE